MRAQEMARSGPTDAYLFNLPESPLRRNERSSRRTALSKSRVSLALERAGPRLAIGSGRLFGIGISAIGSEGQDNPIPRNISLIFCFKQPHRQDRVEIPGQRLHRLAGVRF